MGNENLSYGTGMKYLEHQSKDISTVSAEAIAENMFQAIDTIVSKRLENLPYNTTKICMVIDDTHKDLGIYRVSDNTATFIAYSDSTDYKVEDRVRVSIDNNDMTKKKYIIGKYLSNDINSLITASSPMDEIIPIITSAFVYNGSAIGLTTNNKNGSEIGVGLLQGPIDNSQLCNALYIKANFQSNLDNYDMRSGEYGLRIILNTIKEGKTISSELVLSSKDMIGNPYNLLTFTTQSGIYDISELGVIQSASIIFYQNNDFKYWNGTEATYLEINPDIKNLFVEDVEIGLGIADLTSINDNTLQLYTNDTVEYGGADAQPLEFQKDLHLVWYNKSGANSYIGFSDGIYGITQDEEGQTKEYDELEYMKIHQDYIDLASQLVYNVPTDKNGLESSKNCKAVLSNLDTIIEYFDNNKNIEKTINSFVSNAKPFFNSDIPNSKITYYDKYISNSEKTGLEDLREKFSLEISELLEVAAKFYNKVLGAARTIQDNGREYGLDEDFVDNEILDDKEDVLLADYIIKYWFVDKNLSLNIKAKTLYNNFKTKWLELIKGLSEDLAANSNKVYYDNFVVDINNIFTLVENCLSIIDNLYGVKGLVYYPLEEKLYNFFTTSYKFDQKLDDFNEKDYSNRYCIYWYQYDSDIQIEDEFEKTFITGNWKHLKDYDNVGLPKNYTTKNNTKYYVSVPDSKDCVVEDIIMRSNKKKEQFMVILFYNHVPYFSNVLEFYNKYYINESVDLGNQATISIENGNNSQDIYQIYGENNQLLNISDKSLKRKIKLNYSGVDGSGNEKLYGAQVFWYVPQDSTLLTFNTKDDLKDFAYDTAEESVSTSEHSREGYYCFYRTIPTYEGDLTPDQIEEFNEALSFTYRVKDIYDKTNNNTIKCKVIANGYVYYPEKTFIFSTFGNNGTEYTFTLSPKNIGLAEAVYDNIPLELEVSLTDASGEKIDVYYKHIDLSGLTTYATGLNNYDILPKDREGETYSPYRIVFLNNKGNEINDTKNTDDIVDYIRIYKIDANDKRYCGVLKFNMDLYKEQTNANGKPISAVKLSYTYPITYLGNQKYTIDGADTIIYDSFGTNPTYDKIEYKLNGSEINSYSWKVKYYNRKSEDVTDTIISTYLPTLENNTLKIPEVFIQEEEIYCVVECIENNTGEVLAARPLNMIQNKYPITTINEWQGGVQIDENGGTIMSAMIAAGCKTIDNKFSGVVMGEVKEDSNDSTLAISGLYGFSNGLQSFGFRSNGTGFIGNSEIGRINFDGTSGSIESALYEENKSGMKISLKDSEITMHAPAQAEHSSGKIIISANDKKYPVKIGGLVDGKERWNFAVDWDGNIEATGTINATAGSIGENVKIEGSSIIGSDQIKDNSVTQLKILDGAVTESKIANKAVTTSKLADGAITVDILPNIPLDKIIRTEGQNTITLSTILDDYNTRIKTVEDKLNEDAFKASVDAILASHNLITV